MQSRWAVMMVAGFFVGCAPVTSDMTVNGVVFHAMSSVTGDVGDGLAVIATDLNGLCGVVTAQPCGAWAEVSGAQVLKVTLPRRTLRTYSLDEAQVFFRGVNVRFGEVTLVSHGTQGTVMTYRFQFETGPAQQGTLVGDPCPRIENYRPFGGWTCVGEQCSCNGQTDTCHAGQPPLGGGTTPVSCDCITASGVTSHCDAAYTNGSGRLDGRRDCCPTPP